MRDAAARGWNLKYPAAGSVGGTIHSHSGRHVGFVDSLERRQLFSAGALDTAFGGDGTVDVRTSTHNWAAAATDGAVDDSGRTVVAAFFRSHRQVSLTRLNVDGTVDVTFGKDGIAAIDSGFNARANGPFHVAVDHAGKVLVTLKTRLTRLNASGGFDRTFGKRGIVAALPVFSDVGDLTVDASDRPLVIGTSPGKAGTRATVERLTASGALDASFGRGGVFKAPVPADGGNARGADVRALADGRISCHERIVYPPIGEEEDHNGDAAFQLDAVGRRVERFGTAGFIDLQGGSTDYSTDSSSIVAIGADGRLLREDSSYDTDGGTVGGFLNEHIAQSDSLYRYDADGHETAARYDFPDFSGINEAVEMDLVALQSDGKVIIDDRGVISRLNADFTRDDAFHVDNAIATVIDFAETTTYSLPRLLLDGDDRLYVIDFGKTAAGADDASSLTLTAIALT